MPRSSTSRRSRRVASAAAVCGSAIALAAAGCGGSSGLSKEDLVKQADPICKRHFETITASVSKVLAGGRLPDPRQFGKIAMGTVIPQYTAQTKELRALKPSDDVKDAYAKWLADSDATRAKLGQNPALLTNPAPFRGVNGEADKLGLSKQCHVGPS